MRSSSGHGEIRPVIRTPLLIAGVHVPVEITLASRDAMGFRMLLGRQALRKRFLIDPGRSYLSKEPGKPKRRAKRSGGRKKS